MPEEIIEEEEKKLIQSQFSNYDSNLKSKMKLKKKKNMYGDNRKSSLPPIQSKKYYQIIPYKKNLKNKNVINKSGINSFMPTDNEELLVEIYHSKNEIQQKIREINELKYKFSLLESDNLTNKYLMEKLLFKENDEETPNGEKPEQHDPNENNDNINNIDNNNEDINTKKKENIKNKQKSILSNTRKKNKKIELLKDEVKYYDNKLNESEKSLEEIKKKEITTQYIILKQANESKIKILEDLLNSCNELNFQLNVLYEKKCDLDEKSEKVKKKKIK